MEAADGGWPALGEYWQGFFAVTFLGESHLQACVSPALMLTI